WSFWLGSKKLSGMCRFLPDCLCHPGRQGGTSRGQCLPLSRGKGAMQRRQGCIGVCRTDPGQSPDSLASRPCSQGQHPAGGVLDQNFPLTQLEFSSAAGRQVNLFDGYLLGQTQGVG